VCVSHFSRFSVFSPYSRSYSVCVSFSMFFRFLAKIQVLQCVFFIFLIKIQVLQCLLLIFHVFSVSHHIPGPTLCVSLFASFSMFLAIFHVLPCEFSFPRLSVFSPYSRSYSVFVSFYTFFSFLAIIQVLWCTFLIFPFFSVSLHISGHTMFVSPFPRFLLFSTNSR
jgi:hypothetical protein